MKILYVVFILSTFFGAAIGIKAFYDVKIESCQKKYDVYSCVIVALPKPMQEGASFCTNSTENK